MSLNVLWLTPSCNNEKFAATSETLEAGTGFIYQFSNAFLPLYSLQQAVKKSRYFKNLTYQTGQYGKGEYFHNGGKVHNYRNVPGICDNAAITDNFYKTVSSIENNSDLDEIFLQRCLVLKNVFCCFKPLLGSDSNDFGAGPK